MAYLLVFLMFASAFAVAHLLVRVSNKLVSVLLSKIIEDEALCTAWIQYVRLAVYVIAFAGGIEVYRLERVFSTEVALNQFFIEIFRVARDASVSVVWLLLPVFLTSLVIMEVRKTLAQRSEQTHTE